LLAHLVSAADDAANRASPTAVGIGVDNVARHSLQVMGQIGLFRAVKRATNRIESFPNSRSINYVKGARAGGSGPLLS